MNNQSDLDKIKSYFEDTGVTAYEVAQKTGITEAGIGKILNGVSKNPRKNTLDKLLSYFEKDSNNDSSVNTPPRKNDKPTNLKKVPVYETEVTSSIVSSFSDVPEIPSYYLDYEPFNDCDAVVTNYGDSMYPAYKNGERLAIKKMNNFDVITWGETFLVITDSQANDLRTVKEVHEHKEKDKIILRASNPRYSGDTVVSKENVLALFAVKGKISQNFL